MERQTVTITVEDMDDGSVSVVCVPSFGDMQTMRNRIGGLSSAQVYAIAMMNRAREINKRIEQTDRKGRIITLDDI